MAQSFSEAVSAIGAATTQLLIARSILTNLGRERTEDEDAVYRLLQIEQQELADIETLANDALWTTSPEMQRFRAAFRKSEDGSN